MIIIRPIQKSDTEKFLRLAAEVDVGMTSLPKNPELLRRKAEESVLSFAITNIKEPGNQHYIFLMEDLGTGKIVGTCKIDAKTGVQEPLYFYHVESSHQHPMIRVVRYKEFCSEIGSLYLTPAYRHHGLGHLLSLSRFLFIANFPERFDKMIFAIIHGYFDEEYHSPFWEGLGRHFLDVEFPEVINLQEHHQIDYSSALPQHPIYINLLPRIIQETIGKIHPQSQPALNMLCQEGFILTDEIDVFDGGPKIEAEIQEIRTVKASVVGRIAEITTDHVDSINYLISNQKIDFRACIGQLETKGSEIKISREIADALKLKVGDSIRYVKKDWH